MYVAEFLKTNLIIFAVISLKRRLKAREAPKSRNEGKGKENNKERGEGNEENRKKQRFHS